MIDFSKIKVIAFDADDTLWTNEPNYRAAEAKYAQIMIDDYRQRVGDQGEKVDGVAAGVACGTAGETAIGATCGDGAMAWMVGLSGSCEGSGADDSAAAAIQLISQELYKTEMSNMELLGYGAKAFTISLVENAIKISGGKVSTEALLKIIAIGKSLLQVNIEPLEGVEKTLQYLTSLGKYRVIYVTKGELRDQGNKLKRSGLKKYFDHDEIMPDKIEENYLRLFKILNIKPEEFLMVGNSLKSDILPVLNLGGYGVYIPFSITWLHEVIPPFDHDNMIEIGVITELIDLIK